MLKNPASLILDLFFPRRCVSCGLEGGWACEPCRAQVEFSLEFNDASQTLSLFNYQDKGLIRELLHNLKYNGIWEVGLVLKIIAEQKASKQKIINHFSDSVVLIPVPCRLNQRKVRGYNQAEEIAKIFGEWLGWPVWEGVLIRQKQNSQVGKDAVERQNQADKTYAWAGKEVPDRFKDKEWVVIDDILTSGGTMRACQAALQPFCGQKIKGLVMAHKIENSNLS